MCRCRRDYRWLLILLVVTQGGRGRSMGVRGAGREMGARMHLHVRLCLVHFGSSFVKQLSCSTNVSAQSWLKAKDKTALESLIVRVEV